MRALLETLSLANPQAFGRAERIKQRVSSLLASLDVTDTWEIEVAAMLSQLGAVTLPPNITEALHQGERLGPAAMDLVNRVPQLSADLLSDVPRLEEVRRSILLQQQRFDGRGPVSQVVKGTQIPLGARILHVAIDYDSLEARGTPSRDAVAAMRAEAGRYDPAVLDVLELVVTTDEDAVPVQQIPLSELRSGQILAADLMTQDGVLLSGRGQEVTERLLRRLENWAQSHRIIEPVHVLHAPGAGGAA